MTNKSNNSPGQVVSRLIHSDYFSIFSEEMMKEWNDIITIHKLKCRHPKCKSIIFDGKKAEEYYLKHSD